MHHLKSVGIQYIKYALADQQFVALVFHFGGRWPSEKSTFKDTTHSIFEDITQTYVYVIIIMTIHYSITQPHFYNGPMKIPLIGHFRVMHQTKKRKLKKI